jgi:hypothetical protein
MENDTTTQKVENTNKVETVQIEKKALIAIGAIVVALILLTFGVLGYQMMLTLNSNKINNVVSSSSRSDSVATLISRTSSSSAMDSSALTSSATSNSANFTTSASSTEQGASDNKYYKYETNNGQYIQFDHPVGAKVDVDGGDIEKSYPVEENCVSRLSYKGITDVQITKDNIELGIYTTGIESPDAEYSCYGGMDGYSSRYSVYTNLFSRERFLRVEGGYPGSSGDFVEYKIISSRDFELNLDNGKKAILARYILDDFSDDGEKGIFVAIKKDVDSLTGEYVEKWDFSSISEHCCMLSVIDGEYSPTFNTTDLKYNKSVYVDGFTEGNFPTKSGYSFTTHFADFGRYALKDMGGDVFRKYLSKDTNYGYITVLKCGNWYDENIERCVELYNTYTSTAKRLK